MWTFHDPESSTIDKKYLQTKHFALEIKIRKFRAQQTQAFIFWRHSLDNYDKSFKDETPKFWKKQECRNKWLLNN